MTTPTWESYWAKGQCGVQSTAQRQFLVRDGAGDQSYNPPFGSLAFNEDDLLLKHF